MGGLLMTYYGTVSAGNAFFAERLHSTTWTEATATEREIALKEATVIIDRLNFKGDKHAVALLSDDATDTEIRAANVSQELEFPRDDDTAVPTEITQACYLIAYALLDGVDPELETRNLAITSHRYSSVATAYNRDMVPLEHVVNGVPSVSAWNLLRPFLRDTTGVKLVRT
jgi:hypothetical protein